MLLSSISSTENYPIHAGSFGGFAVFQTVSLLIIVLLQRGLVASQPNEVVVRSYNRKKFWFIVNQLGIVCVALFFWRHNEYCEPYS